VVKLSVSRSESNDPCNHLFPPSKKEEESPEVSEKDLHSFLKKTLQKPICLTQTIQVQWGQEPLTLMVESLEFLNEEIVMGGLGLIVEETELQLVYKDKGLLFKSDQESGKGMDIREIENHLGGISDQLGSIFKSIVLAWGPQKKMAQELGLRPPRGLLLYGPPGTGKTALARQLGKLLGAEPHTSLHNATEVLNKWMGASEQNIRNWFTPAKEAWKRLGDKSPLHVVIVDEIDAILQTRQENELPWYASVVNTLLGELDGLKSEGNFLFVGITNRKELLDPAAIRPGRLGKHIYIGLPDLSGRKRIFEIHTKMLAPYLAPDVDLGALARQTEGFSGAEIEGVAQSASTCLLEKAHQSIEPRFIYQRDFEQAMEEIRASKPRQNSVFDYGNDRLMLG
jgi:ATP-dependent 26S proteasome regulatory subunit